MNYALQTELFPYLDSAIFFVSHVLSPLPVAIFNGTAMVCSMAMYMPIAKAIMN